MNLTEEQIRNAVRQRYSRLAVLNEPCCGEAVSSCGSSNSTPDASLPSEALSIVASCGSPLIHVQVREGETVLDLGSGGGIDVFRASKLVGKRVGLLALTQQLK